MNTYFENRKKEMMKMKFEQGLSNIEIGKTYNISRERVRQIIGNTGRFFKSEWTKRNLKNIDFSNISREELGELPGAKTVYINEFPKHRHKINGGYLERGTEIEELVSQKLSELNINHQLMTHFHPYDIELENGMKGDIKAAFKEFCSKSHRGYPYYKFSVRRKQDRLVDFYIGYIVPTKDYFIIPSHETTGTQIRVVWPMREGAYISKWHKYHDRFDLLK